MAFRRRAWTLPSRYSSDVAFTPSVRAIQTCNGSRDGYAHQEQKGAWPLSGHGGSGGSLPTCPSVAAHLPCWLLLRVLAYRIQVAALGGPDKATLRVIRQPKCRISGAHSDSKRLRRRKERSALARLSSREGASVRSARLNFSLLPTSSGPAPSRLR